MQGGKANPFLLFASPSLHAKRKSHEGFPCACLKFQRLEFVVEGNGILIIRISVFIRISCKCVFTVEGDVLLQCYISRCVPEAAVFLQQFIIGQPPAANAICKYTLLYIKVCYINAPRPRFLCIDSAIAKTCYILSLRFSELTHLSGSLFFRRAE